MAADALHITLVQRIIRKHRNLRHVSVDGARREVEFLAGRVHAEGQVDKRLREHLERDTGMSIAELAKFIAENWPRT